MPKRRLCSFCGLESAQDRAVFSIVTENLTKLVCEEHFDTSDVILAGGAKR